MFLRDVVMLNEVQSQFANLSHNEILELDRDYMKAAKSAKLRYVNDSMPGIVRVKKGKGFVYYKGKEQVKDSDVLERIKKLVIPPAWTNVWICSLENGHIQATGYDVRKRKQYKYHTSWSAARNESKFHRLYEFGKVLPLLRAHLEKDLTEKELSQRRVIATVISLMERTYIRIGNEDYEKMYGSHGITTLKDNHVKVNGSEIKFSFTGKKGIAHSIMLKNRKLARMVKECRDIPGKELFQYYDKDCNRHPIESGMVNDYIKDATGADFTAKDFRTWAGSLNLLRSLRSIGEAVTETECKKNLVMALDEVSKKLGNTRTVCKKYYVHPGLIHLYEQNNLSRYLKELDDIEEPDLRVDLTTDEKIFMRILKTLH
jgi:DNA topoisomerase I